MHQDITPLCAADIEDQLKKQFAYLSGKDSFYAVFNLSFPLPCFPIAADS